MRHVDDKYINLVTVCLKRSLIAIEILHGS